MTKEKYGDELLLIDLFGILVNCMKPESDEPIIGCGIRPPTVETKPDPLPEIQLSDRDTVKWATYETIDDVKTLRWILLRDLTNEHIINILTSPASLAGSKKRVLVSELNLRLKHPEYSIIETGDGDHKY